MSAFLQAIGLTLVAAILSVVLSRSGKDITLVLSLGACCIVMICGLQYLKPVIELVETLEDLSNVDPQLLKTLLKATAVGLISEVACLICNDSGNAALGKTIEVVSACVILWLSVPLMTQLLEIIQEMVGQS